MAPVLVWLRAPGLVGAERLVVSGAVRVALGKPVGERDDHGGLVRLGAARGEVTGPALGIDAEGLHDQVDAVLLEGGGGRVLAPDRDIRAAPVGLVHGGNRGRIGIDAEVAHVQRAAHVGVVEVGKPAEHLHEPVHRDIAGAWVEILAHRRIDRFERRSVAGRRRLHHGGDSVSTGRRWTRNGPPLVALKSRVEDSRLTFSSISSIYSP